MSNELLKSEYKLGFCGTIKILIDKKPYQYN